MATDQHKEVRLVLSCGDTDACTVALEPDGTTHTLGPDDTFSVRIHGPGTGEVEVMHLPDGLTLWAWFASDYEVTNRAGDSLPI
jgi:hypothetical protein